MGITPQPYPSVREPSYDPGTRTVAASVGCVPLLWLAGFESSDVVRDHLKASSGELLPIVAAVVGTSHYLERLQRGANRLARALGAAESALLQHAEMLGQAVRTASFADSFISMELDEICALHREGHTGFERDLADAISGSPQAIERICEWKGHKLPPADLLLADDDGVRKGDVISLDRLLGHAHGRNVPWEPKQPPPPVEPPLIAALFANDSGTALRLVEEGADPNVQSSRGASALMMAVGRNGKIAHALLDRGAKPDDAALINAARRGGLELVERMLQLGANPRAQEKHSQDSALTRACQASADAEPIARLLLDAGADPNVGSTTPIMAALATRRESLVRLLLERGARVDARDSSDRDVSWWAKFSKRPALIQLIDEALQKQVP